MITGAIVSTIQVTVRETAAAMLPQASVAFHVLVWERLHPLTVTVEVVGVGVTGPQASVAVALPSAESMAVAVG